MSYLVDFDLDGDTCECGQAVATHAPLPAPRPWFEGRPCSRQLADLWRGNGPVPEARFTNSGKVYNGPIGKPLQINRPPGVRR